MVLDAILCYSWVSVLPGESGENAGRPQGSPLHGGGHEHVGETLAVSQFPLTGWRARKMLCISPFSYHKGLMPLNRVQDVFALRVLVLQHYRLQSQAPLQLRVREVIGTG